MGHDIASRNVHRRRKVTRSGADDSVGPSKRARGIEEWVKRNSLPDSSSKWTQRRQLGATDKRRLGNSTVGVEGSFVRTPPTVGKREDEWSASVECGGGCEGDETKIPGSGRIYGKNRRIKLPLKNVRSPGPSQGSHTASGNCSSGYNSKATVSGEGRGGKNTPTKEKIRIAETDSQLSSHGISEKKGQVGSRHSLKGKTTKPRGFTRGGYFENCCLQTGSKEVYHPNTLLRP